ncbi:MAG: hypothetical protein D6753_05310 [Planctomycetota bacterium]|nr:MAG: hypothetical protein D6753_05310 [Planctomycetota bacterium]
MIDSGPQRNETIGMMQQTINRVNGRPPAVIYGCRLRRGVSVLEVLFATGIAVAGMLGIASLLLMAGRDASVANRATESQALARAWSAEFLTRGLHHPNRWIWYQDYVFPPPPASGVGPGWIPASKQLPFSMLGRRLTFSTGSQPPLHELPMGKIAICIDPYFYAGRDLNGTLGNYTQPAPAGRHWYRPAVFPYYQDGTNPLVDPTTTIGATGGLAWTDQPRMLRVAVPSTPGGLVPMVNAMVRQLFVSQDEVIVVGDQERKQAGFDASAPTMRRFQPLSGSIPGEPSVASKYSWIATLSPLEQNDASTESMYTLSLVVIFERERVFLPSVRTGGPNPLNTPQGERLMWVQPQSGNFVGGNGGRVRLWFSSAMEEDVAVGDWIMLSKHVAATQTSSSPVIVQPYSIFRWYRVVAVDGDATRMPPGSVTDPYGNNPPEDVWAVDVALEGPDWVFASPISVAPTGSNLVAPTTGTLVKGAVAVYERVVEVPDL